MTPQVQVGQYWKNNLTNSVGKVVEILPGHLYADASVNLTVSYGGVPTDVNIKLNRLQQNWVMVKDTSFVDALKIDDQIISDANPDKPATILWVKADRSSFLVSRGNDEWVVTADKVGSYWRKYAPNPLPEGVERINLKSDPSTSNNEDTVKLSNSHRVYGSAEKTMTAVTNTSNGILMVAEGIKNGYWSMYVTPEQLEFLIAEHKRSKTEK